MLAIPSHAGSEIAKLQSVLFRTERLWKLLMVIFVMLKKGLDYLYLEDRFYNRKLRALNAVA